MREWARAITVIIGPPPHSGQSTHWAILPFFGFLAAVIWIYSGDSLARDRDALWNVVTICELDYRITGAAFPCLKVNEAPTAIGGYIVLQPPVGEKDLILVPTRKISGVEDRDLAAVSAPNYFAMAWKERSMLGGGKGSKLERDDFALAVNSELTRSQDQVHIHIGCLSSPMKRWIAEAAGQLAQGRWLRLDMSILGFRFWGRLVEGATLDGVNPFRLVAVDVPGAETDPGAVTIVVAGARIGEREQGFVVLASLGDRSRPYSARPGSDILDHTCGRQR